MSQITYSTQPGALAGGMLADIGPDLIKSYKNTTGAVLPFGVMVALGAADDRLKRLTGPTDKLIGVVCFEHGRSNQGENMTSAVPFGTSPDTDSYAIPDKVMASVVRHGAVVVIVEDAVTCELEPFVRITAGAGEVVGAFRSDSDGGDAIRIKGARFITSAGAGEAAVLLLEGPLSYEVSASADGGRLGFIQATVGAEAAVAANAIEVACQLLDQFGAPLAEARNILITSVPETANEGDIAAAGTPVGTISPIENSATGDNNAGMISTSAGLFSFRITNTAAEVNQVVITADGCIPRVLRLTFT